MKNKKEQSQNIRLLVTTYGGPNKTFSRKCIILYVTIAYLQDCLVLRIYYLLEGQPAMSLSALTSCTSNAC